MDCFGIRAPSASEAKGLALDRSREVPVDGVLQDASLASWHLWLSCFLGTQGLQMLMKSTLKLLEKIGTFDHL